MNEHIIETFKKSMSLNKRVVPILNELEIKYGKEDIRFSLISRPLSSIMIQILTIKIYQSTLYKKEWWNSINVPDTEIKNLGELHEMFLKKSQFFDFASLVESDFRRLIRKLSPGACGEGKATFESIYKKILFDLSLTEFTDLFQFMSLIRNTIHNNGFHFHPKDENNPLCLKEKHFYLNVEKLWSL